MFSHIKIQFKLSHLELGKPAHRALEVSSIVQFGSVDEGFAAFGIDGCTLRVHDSRSGGIREVTRQFLLTPHLLAVDGQGSILVSSARRRSSSTTSRDRWCRCPSCHPAPWPLRATRSRVSGWPRIRGRLRIRRMGVSGGTWQACPPGRTPTTRSSSGRDAGLEEHGEGRRGSWRGVPGRVELRSRPFPRHPAERRPSGGTPVPTAFRQLVAIGYDKLRGLGLLVWEGGSSFRKALMRGTPDGLRAGVEDMAALTDIAAGVKQVGCPPAGGHDSRLDYRGVVYAVDGENLVLQAAFAPTGGGNGQPAATCARACDAILGTIVGGQPAFLSLQLPPDAGGGT